MLLLRWLLLYFLIPTCQCKWSMLIVWGEVEDLTQATSFSGDWDECIQYCLVEESCVVIRQTANFGCQIFRYGTISSVRTTGTTIIGFKRTMTTCSLAMPSPPLFGELNVTETYQSETVAYQYQITLSQGSYLFSFAYYIQCQNDSFVSLRGLRPVCISVRVFPNTLICANRSSGLSLCQGNGGMGMTGPYSMDEGKIITKYMSDTLISAPTIIKYTYLDFWIDGTRVGLGNYTMTDDTLNGTIGYYWSGQGTPETFSCIFLVLLESGPTTYGQSCGITSDGKYCLRGAVCRTHPFLNLIN